MNKINFKTGYVPAAADFNGLQNNMEFLLETIVSTILGGGCILHEFLCFDIDNKIYVGPGIGFDYGRIISHQYMVEYDIGQITKPAAGNIKWIAVCFEYFRESSGEMVSDLGITQDLHDNENCRLKLIEGPEGVAPLRPGTTGYLLLGDLRLVHDYGPGHQGAMDFSRRKDVRQMINLDLDLTDIDNRLTTAENTLANPPYVVDRMSNVKITANAILGQNTKVDFNIKYPISGYVHFTIDEGPSTGAVGRLIQCAHSTNYPLKELTSNSARIPQNLNPGRYRLDAICDSTTSVTMSLCITGASSVSDLNDTFEIL